MALVKWETNLDTLEEQADYVSDYTDLVVYVDENQDGLFTVTLPEIRTEKDGLSFFDAYYMLEGILLGVIANRRRNG